MEEQINKQINTTMNTHIGVFVVTPSPLHSVRFFGCTDLLKYIYTRVLVVYV